MTTQKRITILGAGESGTGAALLAQWLGYAVFVSDKSPAKPAFKSELEAAGISFEDGQHSMDRILESDLVVKSPGIPEKTPVMLAVREKGIPVVGEIEFAWQHRPQGSKVVGITGSNGKTTTTDLTGHVLQTAGLPAIACGNVGRALARVVLDDLRNPAASAGRIYVVELSSFQLDDIVEFRPDIAVLLNITPDHLDRYEYRLENYVHSKFRITLNQRAGDTFLYNGFDPIVGAALAAHLNPAADQVAIRKGFFKDGFIRIGRTQRFDMRRGLLRGPHNMFNATCAIRTALLLGAAPDLIQEGLESFRPPAHRLEPVADRNGVNWINDSKATNVDAVYYALQAMDRPTIWIVGGQDKGNDYTPLLSLVRRKVKAIVCMGLDNQKIIGAFAKTKKKMIETRSASEAVQKSAELAEPGDTVLLSPACASFDLFKNYEDRGAQFREAVLRLSGVEAAAGKEPSTQH